jgi:hypothetical protein
MEAVMQDGKHYGKIPGVDKPTLLQPGADILNLTFRLRPELSPLKTIQEPQLVSHLIRCDLYHIPTGIKVATGLGSCNSREKKYRCRYEVAPSDKPVPPDYWKARTRGDNKAMKRIIQQAGEGLDGDSFRPVKDNLGNWVVGVSTQVINENPMEDDNTLLKMAAKRAKVAATLNATAASDLFTQDVEDYEEPQAAESPKGSPPETSKGKKSASAQKKTENQTRSPADLEFEKTMKAYARQLGDEYWVILNGFEVKEAKEVKPEDREAVLGAMDRKVHEMTGREPGEEG